MNFSKSYFSKNVSRSKARFKKIMTFTQSIVQIGMKFYKKKKRKMWNNQVNIEYFAFLDY